MTLLVEDSLVAIAKTASTGSDGEVGFQFETDEFTVEGDLHAYLVLASGAVNESITAADVKAGGVSGQVGSQRSALISAGEIYNHAVLTPSGLFIGLSPGTYTFYLCVEDDGIPLLELYTYTFEIEEDATSLGEVEVVSHTSAQVADYQLTFPVTIPDEDGVVLLVLTGNLDQETLISRFDGVSMTPVAEVGSSFIANVMIDPPVGTFNVQVFDENENAHDITAIAIVLSGVDEVREARWINNLTNAGVVNSEEGDLVIAFGGRIGATNLAIESPWDRLEFIGGSGYAAIAAAVRTAEGSTTTGTWTPTGGSGGATVGTAGGVAFVPAAAPPAEEDAPTDVPAFSVAAGHDAAALRNIRYFGEDADTTGFKLQYSLDGGDAVDAAYSSDPLVQPLNLISDLESGDVHNVRMRAVNNAGEGEWSDESWFRVHYDWHRTGIKKFAPDESTGHVAAGYDTVSTVTQQGPLTTGGRDRAVLATHDIAYGTPDASPHLTVPHDAFYDDVQMTKIAQTLSDRDQIDRHGSGGAEAFILTGVPSGTNTHRFTWVSEQSQKSIWIASVALENVDQVLPVGSVKAGMWAATGSWAPPGVTPYPMVEDGDTHILEDVPCGMDELLVTMFGFYAGGAPESQPFEPRPQWRGERPGWSGSNDTLPVFYPTTGLSDGHPVSEGLSKFAGTGAGAEDGIAMGLFTDNVGPVRDVAWAYAISWADNLSVAVRPSPDMLHDLAILIVSEFGTEWGAISDVNHGRILIGVSLISDPAPTSLHLRDAIDDTEEAPVPYAGEFLQLDIIDLGEAGAIGGVLDEITEEGEYRITVAYESWQWNLGDALHTDFEIASVEIHGSDRVSAGAPGQGETGVQVSAVDDAAIAGAESASPLISVAATDTLDLAVLESVALMARLIRTDRLTTASVDAVQAIHAALDRSDTIDLRATGDGSPQVNAATGDALAVGAADNADRIAAVIDRADQAAISASEESSEVNARLHRADEIRLAADDLVAALYGEIESMATVGIGASGSAATAVGVSAIDTAAVAAVDAAGMIAVVVQQADQAALAADDQAGPVLTRLSREDVLALRTPGIAEILAALQQSDTLSISLAAAAQIISEVTQIAGSDAVLLGAPAAGVVQQSVHGVDALRMQILGETASVFAEVTASDSAGLAMIEHRDLAVALAALDRFGIAIDEKTTVPTVVVQVGDGLTLRITEQSLKSAIDNETGRLVGVVSLRTLLDSEVTISPDLAARLEINPDETS